MSWLVWVPVLAVVVSLASIGVTIWVYRRGGPRVSVTVAKNVVAMTGAESWVRRTFVVDAHNGGRGGITVLDVGLLPDDDSGRSLSHTDAPAQRGGGDPPLRHRLDSFDSANWHMNGSVAADAFGDTTKVHGYARIAKKRRGSYIVVSSNTAEFNETP